MRKPPAPAPAAEHTIPEQTGQLASYAEQLMSASGLDITALIAAAQAADPPETDDVLWQALRAGWAAADDGTDHSSGGQG